MWRSRWIRNYFEDPETKLSDFININCTKVRLEAVRMNKSSFLPPLYIFIIFITVIVHFKEAIYRTGNGAEINNFGSATLLVPVDLFLACVLSTIVSY